MKKEYDVVAIGLHFRRRQISRFSHHPGLCKLNEEKARELLQNDMFPASPCVVADPMNISDDMLMWLRTWARSCGAKVYAPYDINETAEWLEAFLAEPECKPRPPKKKARKAQTRKEPDLSPAPDEQQKDPEIAPVVSERLVFCLSGRWSDVGNGPVYSYPIHHNNPINRNSPPRS